MRGREGRERGRGGKEGGNGGWGEGGMIHDEGRRVRGLAQSQHHTIFRAAQGW